MYIQATGGPLVRLWVSTFALAYLSNHHLQLNRRLPKHGHSRPRGRRFSTAVMGFSDQSQKQEMMTQSFEDRISQYSMVLHCRSTRQYDTTTSLPQSKTAVCHTDKADLDSPSPEKIPGTSVLYFIQRTCSRSFWFAQAHLMAQH